MATAAGAARGAATNLPATRKEAFATGAKSYATGKPCRRGHVAPRYTQSGACTICVADANAAPAGPPASAERNTLDQLDAADRVFLHNLVMLGSRAAAAAVAWPHLDDPVGKAAHTLQRKAVRDELDKLREEVRRHTAYSVEQSMLELEGAIQHAIATGNATAHSRCIELRARLHGLLVDKQQVRVEHLHIDLAGVLERARRPLRDQLDVVAAKVIAPAALPGRAGGEPLRVSPARPMPAHITIDDVDPFS